MSVPAGVRYRDMTPEQQRECRVNLAIVIGLGLIVLSFVLAVLVLSLAIVSFFVGFELSLGGIVGYAIIKTASVYHIQPLTVGLGYLGFVVLMILACVLTRQVFVVKGGVIALSLIYLFHSILCLFL